MSNNKKITLSIGSELEQVRLLGQAIQRFCKDIPFEHTSVNQVELAVVESVNNCIEHAYGYKKGFTVDLEIDVSCSQLMIAIRDQGIPMTPEVIRELIDPDVHMQVPGPDTEQLPESGWGMQLVKTACDSISYDRQYSSNTIMLYFELEKKAA